MTEELLSLKWNNHQSHFVDILTFLREQEIFIDATLACGGKLYPAHKFVLSTCSDYFKQMFTKNPNKHPIVFMKDVTCRDLEALLDFMYNGEVNVPQSSLGSLIKTAEGLQIKGLAVPDDPPAPKRDVNIRERRDVKVSRDNSYSPPPKRLRAREKSPHLISSAPAYPSATLPRARSPTSILPNVTTGLLPIEASVDEDSRTSAQSALSEHSLSLNSKPNLNNQSHYNNDDSTSQSDNLMNQPSNKEPSPGPSGLHKPTQSKEEEVEIKQEDVVDLGQTDEGDWGGGGEGDGSMDDGGGDSLTSENAPNFSDVLMPPSDGALNTTGDPAMGLIPVDHLPFHPMVIVDEGTLRPHRCTYCGRRFKRKDHRAEHERIHTGERPYVCASCGRAFIQKHQLVSHTRRKHNYSAATDSRDGGGMLVSPESEEGGRPPFINASIGMAGTQQQQQQLHHHHHLLQQLQLQDIRSPNAQPTFTGPPHHLNAADSFQEDETRRPS